MPRSLARHKEQIKNYFCDSEREKNHRTGGGGPNKFNVIGAVEQGGNVVARVLDRVTSAAARSFVREAVGTGVSLLNTDEALVYRDLKHEYNHGTVDHARRMYVVCALHMNTLKAFGA